MYVAAQWVDRELGDRFGSGSICRLEMGLAGRA